VYLSDLLRSLGRRWYVVLIGLLATGVLSVGALRLVPVQHVATSSLLLLPPTNTVGAGGNPYLALGGLQAAADVLSRALGDDTVSERIAPVGGPATYTVASDHTTSGPILYIEVTDSTDAGAVATLGEVIDAAPGILRKLQSDVGAPTESLMSVETITRDTISTPQNKSQQRAVILVAVVGLAGTVLGTNLLNSLLVRRSTRAAQRRSSSRAPGTRGAVPALVPEPTTAADDSPSLEPSAPSSRTR